jgi:hypothetical protein
MLKPSGLTVLFCSTEPKSRVRLSIGEPLSKEGAHASGTYSLR